MPEDLPKQREPIPKHILDFIFVRELREVYLLMDHVSGRWDKCITDTDLVKSICEIGWPPTGTQVEQAAQAAALLSAKDKLNRAVKPARWFKWEIRIIIVLLLLWLMATCFLSWDLAAGHAIYVRVDALRVQESQYDAKIKAIEAEAAKRDTTGTRTPDIGLFLERNCRAPRLDTPPQRAGDNVEPFRTVDELRLCNEMSRSRAEFAVGHQDLAEWLAVWKYWLTGLASTMCRHKCLPVAASSASLTEVQTNEQWGAILLEVLATAVLPLCYGLLGAGAAVVRDLWGKMKESLLSPRDLTLALGQLALGAVVGACIGLFVSPSGNSSQSTNGLLGSVVLSASALSFVAGFGVEGVFVALESLIKRVFNIPQAAQST